jgi:hypothetical protein
LSIRSSSNSPTEKSSEGESILGESESTDSEESEESEESEDPECKSNTVSSSEEEEDADADADDESEERK